MPVCPRAFLCFFLFVRACVHASASCVRVRLCVCVCAVRPCARVSGGNSRDWVYFCVHTVVALGPRVLKRVGALEFVCGLVSSGDSCQTGPPEEGN